MREINKSNKWEEILAVAAVIAFSLEAFILVSLESGF